MANPIFTGATADTFNKASCAVFVNFDGDTTDSGDASWTYVGKTQNSKSLTPIMEKIEWKDNEDGSAITYVEDISETGLQIGFSFMQFGDVAALQLALNAELDTSSESGYDVLHLLENPSGLTEFGIKLVGQLRDGSAFEIIVYRGSMMASGDITMGEIGSFSEVPVTVTSLKKGEITPGGKRSFGKIRITQGASS